MEKLYAEAQERLQQTALPATDLDERLKTVEAKARQTNDEIEQSRQSNLKTLQQFDKIKSQRLDRFNRFFEPIADNIDEVYKKLTKSLSAQAYLGPMNAEEPYLDGMQYNCVAPGKRFRAMENLSGKKFFVWDSVLPNKKLKFVKRSNSRRMLLGKKIVVSFDCIKIEYFCLGWGQLGLEKHNAKIFGIDLLSLWELFTIYSVILNLVYILF